MYYYVHIGDEGPQGPPTRRTEIKSTKPKPSAQWAVLVSLVAHQTIEALTGIYVGAIVDGEAEPSLIAIVTLILRGRHTY